MKFTATEHPVEKEFPKLIRDNIPAIIQNKTGKPGNLGMADTDEEYFAYLLKKLVEEAQEAKFSPMHGNLQEELADVLEVIDAILALRGLSKGSILRVQDEKRQKNGGFKKRLLLLSDSRQK